jgi:hypothetical protein
VLINALPEQTHLYKFQSNQLFQRHEAEFSDLPLIIYKFYLIINLNNKKIELAFIKTILTVLSITN